MTVMGKGCDSLDDVFNGKACDVKVVEGTPQLQPHGPRGYYMQLQIGIFCTGLRESKVLRSSKLSSLFPMMHSSVQRLS